MKKFISTLLAALTVLNIGTAAFAVEYNETNASFSDTFIEAYEHEEISEDYEITEDKEEAENTIKFDRFFEEDDVAEMYLCATAHSLTGHMWIYITNTSDEPIEVGYVTVEPGESISVGNLRNSRKDGGGTYYNGEAYMSTNLKETSDHTTYLMQLINLDELEKVSKEIKSHNTYSLIGYNCTNLACDVWNAVAKTKVISLCLPVFTIFEMGLFGGRNGNPTMDRPEITEVFKQVSGGVRQACAESFESSCVG